MTIYRSINMLWKSCYGCLALKQTVAISFNISVPYIYLVPVFSRDGINNNESAFQSKADHPQIEYTDRYFASVTLTLTR